MSLKETNTNTLCYHCGEICKADAIIYDGKNFCCSGCKLVYELLSEKELCEYYNINRSPGISLKKSPHGKKFEYLDEESISKSLLSFNDGVTAKVVFFIPSIHCSSCLWLLENLFKLNPAITHSSVEFLSKKVSIRFNVKEISLRQIVELLASIGYEPKINLEQINDETTRDYQRQLTYKIGIAGFAFGNIMLLSFPEYLAIDASSVALKHLFAYLIFFLSLPVFFYCSLDYFRSAIAGLKSRMLNIDFPLSLGILAFYTKSVHDIFTGIGPGYMDSFAGLIFFLLLGKIFQYKTFSALNFERNYKSYFPLSAIKVEDGHEKIIPLSRVAIGDRLRIRNNELIPADSILVSGDALIDYSFITGESLPVQKGNGDLIFAGGKQTGSIIEVTVVKSISQSYLTQLWNENIFSKKYDKSVFEFSNKVSKYFTIVLLIIAFTSGFYYWNISGSAQAIEVFTVLLIIACPCALALSSPFAFGNALRILGKNKFFLKNAAIVERLSKINTIVFDKTGTITYQDSSDVQYQGRELTNEQFAAIKALVKNSTHPLSKKIAESIEADVLPVVHAFNEKPGYGIDGFIDGVYYRLGSLHFISEANVDTSELTINNDKVSVVYLSINSIFMGGFGISNRIRPGIREMVDSLVKEYDIRVLSGDNADSGKEIIQYFSSASTVLFEQSPYDKLRYIGSLENDGKKVMMVGDGLNDAGALKHSSVGVSIAEDVINFTPSSDAILQASELYRLKDFLDYGKDSMNVIKISFGISLAYNIAGVLAAINLMVTPLFAAVLMPVSSVTVVAVTVGLTSLFAKKRRLL